jgi:uncharacterized protein with HEPN domain
VKRDVLYLDHILESIRRVEENTAGGYERFMATHTLQDAVLRNLQTMAESTQRLSDAAKLRRPAVDWRALAGFRNVLTHNYLGIDLDQIWAIVQRDVPLLKTAAAVLRSELPD